MILRPGQLCKVNKARNFPARPYYCEPYTNERKRPGENLATIPLSVDDVYLFIKEYEWVGARISGDGTYKPYSIFMNVFLYGDRLIQLYAADLMMEPL